MGFEQIFWGVLLSFFDFRIQGLDILPDFIGYILIFNGVNKLKLVNDRFAKAGQFAMPLIVLSIFDIYQNPQHVNGSNIHIPPMLILYNLIISLLICFLFYNICKGIEERALVLGLSELARQSRTRFIVLLIFQCIVIFFPFIFYINLAFAGILGLVLLILSIIVIILLMTLMKSVNNQFPQDINF